MSAEEVLRKYWGHTSFRSPQSEIIQSVTAGKDVLAILPTGGGKSVCFQIPALLKDGLCLVITPLIALMQDQVSQLKKKGIPAIAIHSGLGHREIDILLDNCVYGNQKFLYVSPERLKTDLFRERFRKMNVNLIAIDEAHCISQWGYDFRPPYLQIAELREIKAGVPFIALTASATKQVKEDILEKLQLKSALTFQKSFARENISLVVRKTEVKEKKALEILTKVPGSAIIYVRSRKSTQSIANFLQRSGISSIFYHAGLNHQERALRQEEWLHGSCRVMVATNAFGMGINKANVRTVIHLDIPENLESYYQEAGRAGRDGKRAYATVLYHTADIDSLKHKVEQSHPAFDYLKRIYQALANHFQLAEGAGQAESYDFDLEQFCKKFGFKSSAVYPALKRLEEAGLIQFNESFFRPSRLHISFNKKNIYEFQVAHERYDAIIKMILRLFGGEVYSDFVTISENQLAAALHQSVEEVKLQLQQLHQLQVLMYEPTQDGPQVTFVLARQDADHLPIDREKMESRRQLHFAKMNKIIQYVEQSQQCRMQFILEYFDEVTYDTCGICDVCLEKKKKIGKTAFADYQQQILYCLHDKKLSPEELTNSVAPKDADLFLEVMRTMVEENQLFYDSHWLLHLKK